MYVLYSDCSSSEDFLKDSIQFESLTCGIDTVKAILSLVPDNQWTMGTFDVSSAFFQGDTLESEVFVKNPEGPSFLVLNGYLKKELGIGMIDFIDTAYGLASTPPLGNQRHIAMTEMEPR